MLENLDRLSAAAWLHAAAASVALLLLWLLARRLPSAGRPAAATCIAILALRFLLFGNPAAWVAYSKILDEHDVGRRQHGTILLEARRYLAHPEPVPFLAVGSSQTWALYGRSAEQEEDLEVLQIAGMGPLDYMLFRRHIAQRKPRQVLLYLSECDLARDLPYEALRTAPRAGSYWLRLFPRLLVAGRLKSPEGTVFEMLAGEVLPEYKYGFVLRGLLGKLVGTQAALGIELAPELPDEERLRLHLQGLTSELDARFIRMQVSFVRDFAAFCRARDIRLVIVEGQYHPRALTTENQYLNAIVSRELAALAAQETNVTFIPREEQLLFAETDYRDGLHVREEAAARFVSRLLERLRAEADPAPPRCAPAISSHHDPAAATLPLSGSG